jgi:hypothetical protein
MGCSCATGGSHFTRGRSAQHRHVVPVFHLKLPQCHCADGYLDMQLLRNPRLTLFLRDGPFFDEQTGEMHSHA